MLWKPEMKIYAQLAAFGFLANLSTLAQIPQPAVVANPPAQTTDSPKPGLKATLPGLPGGTPGIEQPLTSRNAADALSPEEIKQAVDLLRDNYIRPENLSEEALARAGLEGLLERLGAGARVYPKRPEVRNQPQPFKHELLSGGVVYIRMGSLDPENLAALDKALNEQAAKPAQSLVLDLRASPHTTDFEFAAEVCRRFCPRGRILFSIKRPKVNDEEILTSRDEPRWRGSMVVLVDGDTAGAGEVVAAVLRTHLRAYVVGQKTQGEAAQFEDIRLPSGRTLRIAVGEVTLPDNSPVFPGGLQPDLTVTMTQEQTDAVLAESSAKGIAVSAEDKERPRMNEAALVAGTNPELDALQQSQKKKGQGEAEKPPLKDLTLQRALDYLTSVRVYEAAMEGRR